MKTLFQLMSPDCLFLQKSKKIKKKICLLKRKNYINLKSLIFNVHKYKNVPKPNNKEEVES